MAMRCRWQLLALILALMSLGPAQAQIVEWQSFTGTGTIRQIATGGDQVWAATTGGVLSVESATRTVTKFTNTEGLSGNNVVAAEVDASGAIWFALADGLLNRYSPASDTWRVIRDYSGQQVTDIVAFGDSLYVGLGIGVSLFDIEKSEVKETYTNFDLSSGNDVEKIAARSVFLNGTDIWVATDKGIAQSSIELANLQAPSSWTQHQQGDGLRSNLVRMVLVSQGVVYAATRAGISLQQDGVWQDAGLDGSDVFALAAVEPSAVFSQSTVVAATADRVFSLEPSGNWQSLGPSLRDITALSSDQSGDIWIGRDNLGVASFNADATEWNLADINSPASNDFKSLMLDPDGKLWCASQGGGIHIWDGELWTNLSRATGLPSNDYRTFAIDTDGRIWAGSWGGGITILEETSSGLEVVSKIDTAGGILSGFIGDPAFVLVPELLADASNNIWMLNREAVNTQVLATRTVNDEYAYFSTNEGIISRFVTALEVDQGGRIWLGTQDRGVQVVDYGLTLFDASDDDLTQGLNTNDGIFTNEITSLAEDKDGTIWIGTVEGLNFWAGGLPGQQFGIINSTITTIGVDGRNNKWIGTVNGVTVLRRDREKIADYSPSDSPLVAGNIQSFAFNETTGEVWIGTDNGLSRALTLFTAPKEDLSQLTGFPNPFIVDGSDKQFVITNLAEDTDINIFTASGRLVKTFKAIQDIEGAQAFWDGTDEDGMPVASGVYVYLASTDNDISASGKVAVVRR